MGVAPEAKLQLFAHKHAEREACRETGLEERERERGKIDANDGRVLPHTQGARQGPRRAAQGAAHLQRPRLCPANGRSLPLTDGQLKKAQ